MPFTIVGMVAAAFLSVLGVIAANLLSVVNPVQKQPRMARFTEPYVEQHDQDLVEHEEQRALTIKPRKSFKELESVLLNSQAREKQAASGKVLNIRHASAAVAGTKPSSICMLSPGGDLGSSASWLLARKLSEAGRQVVLIDLGGGAVCTRRMLGTAEVPGIFNLMTGAVTVEAILKKDNASDVCIVPSGNLFAGREMLDTQLLSEMIGAIAESFDHCIIDCGDVDAEEVAMIAEPNTIMMISCIKAEPRMVQSLETNLEKKSYKSVLSLLPDKLDIGNVQEAA
ncbi:MAG: hypothetical protein AAF412_10115 [Pseudomonadota bacterium]